MYLLFYFSFKLQKSSMFIYYSRYYCQKRKCLHIHIISIFLGREYRVLVEYIATYDVENPTLCVDKKEAKCSLNICETPHRSSYK